MFQPLPFIAGISLAIADRLTTCWGILIMVVAFFLSVGYATAEQNPDHRENRVEVFTLLLPSIAAIYIGDAIWHPWGAIVGVVLMNPVGTPGAWVRLRDTG